MRGHITRATGAFRALRRARLAWACVAASTLLMAVSAAAASDTGDGDADRPETPNVGGRHNWSGRWRIQRRPQDRAKLTEEQRKEIDRLRSLGYAGGVNPPPSQIGVTVYDPERVSDGLNFYTSGHYTGAFLMDMEGRILHTWQLSYEDAWPERTDPVTPIVTQSWRRAHLFENGDVLAIFEGIGLVKVNKDSELLWASDNGSHHDLEVQDDGRIYALTREARVVPEINETHPILEDVSVIAAIRRSAFADDLMDRKTKFVGDITHTNTIELLDGSLADRIPAFREGNVLISIRNFDTLAVVDLDLEEVVWIAREGWDGQHQSTILEGGTMLLFDNGYQRYASRVIEMDPETLEVLWTYEGTPPTDFRSQGCGSNQRLPNGSTLITESDNGRAFEVTHDGDIVWEYWNPERAGEDDQYIATIFEVIRLDPSLPLDWLDAR